MFGQHITSRSARRIETSFLRFWRSLAAQCEAAGAAEPTLGPARRAWQDHLDAAVAA